MAYDKGYTDCLRDVSRTEGGNAVYGKQISLPVWDATLGEHASTINFKGLPSDEDMITVGMNIRMTRARCQQIIEEVRERTSELEKYY